MERLQLSPTIRLATKDDVGDIPDKEKHLKSAQNSLTANIVEGYKIIMVDRKDYSYSFFAEINVNNDNLWALFSKLMMSMPDQISLITGYRSDEPEEVVYSEYEDKYSVLNFLTPYQKQLCQDSFLEFGVIHQKRENDLEEVYVKSPKYLYYWGDDLDKFRTIMHSFSLYETPTMDFVDCYPMLRQAYNNLYPGQLSTEELLEKLRINNVNNEDE